MLKQALIDYAKRSHLSISELARRARIDRANLSRFLDGRGAVGIDKLGALAEVLGLELRRKKGVLREDVVEVLDGGRAPTGISGEALLATVRGIVREELQNAPVARPEPSPAPSPPAAHPDAPASPQRARGPRRRRYSRALRTEALERIRAGAGQTETAEDLGVPVGTLTSWAVKWRRSGELPEEAD